MQKGLSIAVAALAAALALAPRPARAASDTEHPLQITATQGFRIAALTPFDHRYGDVLDAYGYSRMPVYYELLSAEVAYALKKWFEAGGHFAYVLGVAGATDTPGGSGLLLHQVELGGVVRFVLGSHDHIGFDIGGLEFRGGALEIGGGLAVPTLSLRGATQATSVPYLSPGLSGWVSSGRGRIQALFRLRYVISNWPDAFAQGLDLPLGGLVVSAGINISL